MTFPRFHIRIVGLLCLCALVSCSLISETGPLKKKIYEKSDAFTLIEVKSLADIPSKGRSYEVGQIPPPSKGQAYSDKIRSRDDIDFLITDLSEQSPFRSGGGPSKFGPIEVPESGTIEIPYVGSIQVIGKSLSQVSGELEEKIKPVSNTARVTVARSHRVPLTANVIGAVRNPGPVPLERAGITSIDILAASGGPTGAEHLFTYTVRRNGRDYVMDYLAFRHRPFLVEEGDLLSVATDSTNQFYVMGAIKRPTSIAFPLPAPTLADALGAASGLDERRSDPSGVFIFRDADPELVYTFNLKDPASIRLIQRFPIKGNDIVYITEAPLTRWNRMISQILPEAMQALNAASRAAAVGN